MATTDATEFCPIRTTVCIKGRKLLRHERICRVPTHSRFSLNVWAGTTRGLGGQYLCYARDERGTRRTVRQALDSTNSKAPVVIRGLGKYQLVRRLSS